MTTKPSSESLNSSHSSAGVSLDIFKEKKINREEIVNFIKLESDDDTKDYKMIVDKVFKKEPCEMNDANHTMQEPEVISHENINKHTLHETGDCADDNKLMIGETFVQDHNHAVKEEFEDMINFIDVKGEPTTSYLYYYCEECGMEYDSFCTRCPTLLHILHSNVLYNTDERAKRTLPHNILEIKESLRCPGIFALKTIPRDVIFGPVYGLTSVQSTKGCTWKIKNGKLFNEDNENSLNWMQYINSSENILEKNLTAFQYDGSLYYRSNREIIMGEELLVYLDGGDGNSLNDAEMYYTPRVESEIGNVYACTLCCLGFISEAYLVKHKANCPHSSNDDDVSDILQCPFCKIYLSEAEYLKCHKNYCSEEYARENPFACCDCGFKGTTKQNLAYHVKNVHPSTSTDSKKSKYSIHTKPYQCRICYKSYTRNNILQAHLRRHSVEKTPDDSKKFKCPGCRYETRWNSNLKRHLKTHNDLRPVKCRICSKLCRTMKLLKIHFRNHSEGEHLYIHTKEEEFACSGCDFKTIHRSSLAHHIVRSHPSASDGLKEFKCPRCTYRTNQKWDFKIHLKRHAALEPFECEICNKSFTKSRYLKRHLPSHSAEKPFLCQHCDYRSSRKADVVRHLKSHGGAKPYTCKICGKSLASNRNLRTHLRIHSGEKPFVCSVCEFRTSHRSSLLSHMNSHSGLRSFECHICNRPFTTKRYLNTHLRHHTDEKPFECGREAS